MRGEEEGKEEDNNNNTEMRRGKEREKERERKMEKRRFIWMLFWLERIWNERWQRTIDAILILEMIYWKRFFFEVKDECVVCIMKICGEYSLVVLIG